MKDTDLQQNLQQEIDRVNKLCDASFTNPDRAGVCRDIKVSVHKAVRARDKSDITDKILALQKLEEFQ